MANIKDVARLAGVSAGSVSRVYNGHPSVGEDVTARVLAAASELGYSHPRSGRRRRFEIPTAIRRIGLVTLGMDRSLTGLPVIASLLQGAHQRAKAYNLSIVICDIPDPSVVPHIIRSGEVDAAVIKSALQGTAEQWRTPAVEALSRMPHVWLLGRPDGVSGDTCGSDDSAVGIIAADYLVSRGHERLGVFNPKPDHKVFRLRQESFRKQAEVLGAKVTDFLGESGEVRFPINPINSIAEVDETVERMLASSDRPTAVFTPADSIAMLLYRALAERDLRVGRDISVISCHNERLFRVSLYPQLTTIDIHSEDIGACGIDHLVRRASYPDSGGEVTISIAPELVEGESVASI